MQGWRLFMLAILAGLYIGLGSNAYLVALDQGMNKLVSGAIFSLGLILVVVAEAELFTGNMTLMIGLLSKLYRPIKALKNLAIVYAGNLVGSVALASLIYKSGLVNASLITRIMGAKLMLTFSEALIRGVLCNMLVVLAVILSVFAKDIISKIACIIFPVMAFVAAGFEHSIANMFFLPLGMLVNSASWAGYLMLLKNLIPVTIGNIIGGLLIICIHPYEIGSLFKGR